LNRGWRFCRFPHAHWVRYRAGFGGLCPGPAGLGPDEGASQTGRAALGRASDEPPVAHRMPRVPAVWRYAERVVGTERDMLVGLLLVRPL
jgi:hypothetical protein